MKMLDSIYIPCESLLLNTTVLNDNLYFLENGMIAML